MSKRFTTKLGMILSLFLGCLVTSNAQTGQCTVNCASATYCSSWSSQLLNSQGRIQFWLKEENKHKIPLSGYSRIWDKLVERYGAYQFNLSEMQRVLANNLEPCSLLEDCFSCNTQNACSTNCVEPFPVSSQTPFDPNEAIYSSLTTQVVHLGATWTEGMMAIPGVDRIITKNGVHSAFARLTRNDCDVKTQSYIGERLIRSTMSDWDQSDPCKNSLGQNVAVPNFQGTSTYMIGGTLRRSHAGSIICTLDGHVGPELTIKMPMDAMYTEWFLSMQDFYEAAAQANMINQFMDEFIIYSFQNPQDVPGSDATFGVNTPYEFRFYLNDEEMRRYGNPNGKIVHIKLSSHSLAGKDQYLNQQGQVTIGETDHRNGWSYEWEGELACNTTLTVNPANTTTYQLKALSPLGYLTTDEVTVYVNEADLAVTNLSISPGNVFAGDAVTLQATVTNNGPAEGRFDNFFFEVDGTLLPSSFATELIQPGDTRTVSSPDLWTPTAGSFTVRAAGAREGDRPDDNDIERVIQVATSPSDVDSLGLFRKTNANYFLDVNGNGVIDLAGGDVNFAMGAGTDTPISGDWSGTGVDSIGLFREDPNMQGPNRFFLDMNGDNVIDLSSGDISFFMGMEGDEPVVGDWDGDGVDEIGVFRSSNQTFYLDYDGDYIIDTNANDLRYSMGDSNDLPISGDWNGDGIDEVGLFRPGNVTFYLDWNGNGVIDVANGDLQYSMGDSEDLPIIGDWNGDGVDKVGLFRDDTSEFFLDANGNGIIDLNAGDRRHVMGANTDLPLVGRWQ